MKIRIARKVIKRWRRGECNYTDNHFGVVLRAQRKVASYRARRATVKP